MQTVPIVIGVVVLILGVGYLVTSNNEEVNEAVEEPVTEVIVSEETSTTDDFTNDEPSTSDVTSTENTAPGVYAAYNADVVAGSDAEHILLFFHATWCPSCRALDNDIVANADNIPAGVEMYKVDYDTATDLRRQYGITTQHSIIEITASGEAESDISHPLTLEGVLATI